MLLLVAEESRLDQIEQQLVKLHDILEVRRRPDVLPTFFTQLAHTAFPHATTA